MKKTVYFTHKEQPSWRRHRRVSASGGATTLPSSFAVFFDHATYFARLWYASNRARFAGSVMSGPSIGTGGGRRRRIRKRTFRGDRVRRRRRTAQRDVFDGTEPFRVVFVSFGGVGSFVSRLNLRLGLRLGSFVVVRCRHDVRVVHRSLLPRVPESARKRLRRDGDVRVRPRRVFLAGRRRAVAAVAVHHLAEDDGRGRRARLGITR